ncbi:1-phosphofructokinase family hexose kinase [Streptomyces althioticus]|uniref:1-phosphofructokinase family hexose kinase n=1 Tax=Streptomyces TaxID=1883 RepID=UPI0005256771|nr:MULTISPECIES: 1-phosphofructokinase family hexose kinase [Actinomycetes]WTC21250.1 1-phosphofructokinase family hexose kinase [Streptomyces althioticus]GGQ56441.1 sugar kinase [Streptomyces althioticus]GGT41255.1 sugar kinase [Streptomyces matensis]
MILTVTLNAALDVTYGVDSLRPRTSHRVGAVHRRAGGKGVNVARVLAGRGRAVTVTGLAGGPTGALIREDLRGVPGLRDELVPVSGESRRTVTVVSGDDGDATVFNERGPQVGPAEWRAFTDRFAELVREASVVALCGSLPPGLPSDAYARLISRASRSGVPSVLDTSGAPLLDALDARPDVVKPNAAELAAATGCDDAVAGAERLRALGARAVVVSSGPGGLLAVTPDGRRRAVPPERLAGNPTGAGDACVAALAAGLADGAPWGDVLREAVALSAAAVACPAAGDVDVAVHERFRTTVTVEDLHAPQPH